MKIITMVTTTDIMMVMVTGLEIMAAHIRIVALRQISP
jgi:hypothetical protein